MNTSGSTKRKKPTNGANSPKKQKSDTNQKPDYKWRDPISGQIFDITEISAFKIPPKPADVKFKHVPISELFTKQVNKLGFLEIPDLDNQIITLDKEALSQKYTGTLTYTSPESEYTDGSDYRKYTLTMDYLNGVKHGYQAVFLKQIFDEATDVWIVRWDHGQKHGFECFYTGVERCRNQQSVPTPVYACHWYHDKVLYKALYNFSLGICDPAYPYFVTSDHCYAECFYTHTDGSTEVDSFGAVYVQRESSADYTEHELVDVYSQMMAKPGGHNRVLSRFQVASDILSRYTYLEEYYYSRW